MYNTLKKCIKIDLINILTSCAFILALRYLSVFDFVDSIYNWINKINLAKIQAENSAWRLPWDTLENIQNSLLNIGHNLSRFGDVLVLIIGGILSIIIVVIPITVSLAIMGLANNKNKFIPDLIISILFEIPRIIIGIQCINIGVALVTVALQSNKLVPLNGATIVYVLSILVVYIIQLILILKHFKNRNKHMQHISI